MRSNISWKLALGIVCLVPLSQIALAKEQKPACIAHTETWMRFLRTHTFPPYPVASKRAGEQGSEIMQVFIGTDGLVRNVAVVTSSGFPGLDEAGRTWVKQHWRWQPPHQSCSTPVRLDWRLSNSD